MAAANPDSKVSGVPVTVSWTSQGGDCWPPALLEILQSANWRAELPASLLTPTTAGIRLSTLPDNILRIDNTGAAYVPGNTIVPLPSVTHTFDATIGPGEAVEFAFDAPGVADISTTFPSIFWDVQPTDAPIRIGPPFIRDGQLVYRLYRVESTDTAPWDVIVVTGYGSLLIPALVATP